MMIKLYAAALLIGVICNAIMFLIVTETTTLKDMALLSVTAAGASITINQTLKAMRVKRRRRVKT